MENLFQVGGDTVFQFSSSYKTPLVVRAPLPLDKPLRGL